MERLTVERIKGLLDNRLKNTLKLSSELDMSDTEIYNIIYFRLYFDFSTAIEATIANIMYEKYEDDRFILTKSKINSDAISRYLPKDEIVLLVGDFGANIEVKDIKNELSVLDGLIKESFFRNLGVEKRLYDVEAFNSFYTQSRDARNKLAHGLDMENVKFDNSMLFKFMSSYYVLIQFYESICSTTE